MRELLVILDGASEPPREGVPTSLERAVTPALDALCAEGSLTRLRTVAPWLEAGSEHAIPALLGWTPPAPVDRGMVEAAAREIAVGRASAHGGSTCARRPTAPARTRLTRSRHSPSHFRRTRCTCSEGIACSPSEPHRSRHAPTSTTWRVVGGPMT